VKLDLGCSTLFTILARIGAPAHTDLRTGLDSPACRIGKPRKVACGIAAPQLDPTGGYSGSSGETRTRERCSKPKETLPRRDSAQSARTRALIPTLRSVRNAAMTYRPDR
jgi:hypothetical protein